MKLDVRESQIEDALVNAGFLAIGLLNLQDEPRLLVRQMALPSGRLDLLYTYRAKLLLLELKVVRFNRAFLKQILRYQADLKTCQQQGSLLQGAIEPYLLCTEVTSSEQSLAWNYGVNLTPYNPQDVLNQFYENFKSIVFFTEKKPPDIGIWNLHLIHDFMYRLDKTNSVKQLLERVGCAQKTLYNKIKFASELRLIDWRPNHDRIFLSELGKDYVACKNEALPNSLSEKQAELLYQFVMRNPYESSVIVGIAAVVESCFVLSKNAYPVLIRHLIEYFPQYVGKYFDWKTSKAKFNATRMYSNYAMDLGLLAKTRDAIYLTPAGFRFTIQMQMHKNLKMVEEMRF